MMHPPDRVADVLRLRKEGLSSSEISRRTGVPRTTVRTWVSGALPRARRDSERCRGCGGRPHAYDRLPPSYVYLLGLYLGDGCLAAHPRSVYKLRVTLDARYPNVIAQCERAIRDVAPKNKVNRWVRSYGDVEVYSYSKAWPCLFPQHGPGPKHLRPIALASWQDQLVERDPHLLLRGLLHSDGCRFENTGRNWRHWRYKFENLSPDIRHLFCETCARVGVSWTLAGTSVYVSRKSDVSTIDALIGAKS